MVSKGNTWLGNAAYVNINIQEGKMHLKPSLYLTSRSVAALGACLAQ